MYRTAVLMFILLLSAMPFASSGEAVTPGNGVSAQTIDSSKADRATRFEGLTAEQKARKMLLPDKLVVGDFAPDFKLRTRDGKSEIQLSGFRGKKPVVLIFGSLT